MKRSAVVSNRWFVLLSVSLGALVPTTARAEDSPGITVSGTGVAEAMPNVVELTATVEGTAELAGDAIEKYRSNKRRALESLNQLNIKNSSVVGSGLAVNSGTPANPLAAFQGQANQPKAVDKVAVQEQLTITLSDINELSADELLQTVTRIIDVVKDAGLAVGPGPKSMIEMQMSSAKPGALATFKLTDTETLRQQAYQSALEQARAKAERLARLAGVELGAIVSIRETASASGGGENPMVAYIALFSGASSKQSAGTSPALQSIPVTASLLVQFAIAKK